MNAIEHNDLLWQKAWAWVLREHEQSLDDSSRAELAAWLKEDPLHHQTYDEACRLWLLVGLLPPADELDAPSSKMSSPETGDQ